MLIKVQTREGFIEREFKNGTTGKEILEQTGTLTSSTIAIKFNGTLTDLDREINEDGIIAPVLINSEEGIHILRHSAAHILAQAVMELYKGALPAVGPVTDDPPGFFYDIQMDDLDDDGIMKIEEKMREIVKRDYKIKRKEFERKDLLKMFAWNKFKVQLIEENVPPGQKSSVYEQGDFVDFCRGPHLPSTSYLKGFKLLSVSRAYWKGNEMNESLVRIAGTAFPSETELKEYLAMVEEAKKRDHRKIGSEMDLFVMRPEYGPAFPLYTPKGTAIRNELMNYMKQLNWKHGYEEVWTPHAFKTTLWEKSGHMSHYRDNMFLMDIENETYGMKPMNCPGHILIFQRKAWSYREMPARFSEFGTVYRYERSGVTSGLLRVRSITQDDGHAFVRIDQIEEEVGNLLDMVNEVFVDTFKIRELKFKLSTRDENNTSKYTGSSEIWEKATNSLKKSLEKRRLSYEIKEGEAAFYGPKIDVDVRDAIGRYWQLSTIQLDFFMPDSSHFDLKYIDENNTPQQPVMIHRAIFGSLDRFIGVITEHFAGSFPLWLSPIQVRIVNISEKTREYAQKVHLELREQGFRVDADFSQDTINKKIRNSHKEKIPYLVIIGDKEASANRISVRDRKDRQKNLIELGEFIKNVKEEVASKNTELNICS
jgi:threonyl-tRNA synthetase